MAVRRSSRLAAVAALFAGLGVVLAGGAPLLAHRGAVAPMQGFSAFLLGSLLALVGGLLGAMALPRTRSGVGGRGRAWFAVAAGALALAAVLAGALPGRGLPRINDITTSPDDPPAFEHATRDPATRGRDWSYPAAFAAEQRSAYPDLAPIRLAMHPEAAFRAAERAAESLGWQVVQAEPGRGLLEARETSRVFRFVDDVVVRVRPAPGGGAVVDVRSKSRDGRGDLGANANRIRAFAAAVAAGG